MVLTDNIRGFETTLIENIGPLRTTLRENRYSRRKPEP